MTSLTTRPGRWDRTGRELYLTCLVLAFGLAFNLYVWAQQPGTSLDDEVGHFLIARDAVRHPKLILNFWGRTVNTLFFAPFAALGWTAARAWSLIACALTGLVAVDIGRQLGSRKRWLIPLLLLWQPWVLSYGHEVLTVIPAMLAMVAVIDLHLRGLDRWASLIVGSLPLVRHELAVLVAAWVLYRLIERDGVSIAISAVPVLTVNVATLVVGGPLPMMRFFEPQPTERYGAGGWFHFVGPVVRHVGAPIFLLALLGFGLRMRRRRELAITAWYLLLFASHTVIFRFGLFASGGYPVFLLPLAPWFAIMAAFAVERISRKIPSGRRAVVGRPTVSRDLVVGLAVSALLLLPNLPVEGQGYSTDARVMRQVADDLRDMAIESSSISATNVHLFRHLPKALPHRGSAYQDLWTKPPIATAPPCAIFVWDHHYSPRWAGDLDEMRAGGWSVTRTYERGEKVMASILRREPCGDARSESGSAHTTVPPPESPA